MKTVVFAAIAFALAAPVAAASFDLNDPQLTPAQRATIFAIQNSDDNEHKKKQRIKVVIGETATFSSQASRNAAERFIFSNSSDSTNDIQRRTNAATNR